MIKNKNNPVLAIINGEKINRKVFTRHYYNEWENFVQQQSGKKMTATDEEMVKCNVVNRLIDKTLLLQHSKKLHIKAEPLEVEAEFEKIKSNFKDEMAFEIELAELGASEEELKEDIKESIILSKLYSHIKKSLIKISDQQLEEYYRANKEAIDFGEGIHLGHILIKTYPGEKDEALKQALDRIRKVKARLDKGESFEKIAAEISECTSSKNGGDLGFVIPGMLDDETFESVAISTKVGKHSDIFETEEGFHILKVYEKQKHYKPGFPEVKTKLMEFVIDYILEEEIENLLDDIKEKADIEIFDF